MGKGFRTEASCFDYSDVRNPPLVCSHFPLEVSATVILETCLPGVELYSLARVISHERECVPVLLQAGARQKLRSDIALLTVIHIHLGVELAHDFVGELSGELL